MAKEHKSPGGLLVGETDKNGGSGIKVVAPEGNILMGGGELILTSDTGKSTDIHEFDGKKMTPCEIASELNVRGGGVKIPCHIAEPANTTDSKMEVGDVIKKENGGSIGNENLTELQNALSKYGWTARISEDGKHYQIANRNGKIVSDVKFKGSRYFFYDMLGNKLLSGMGELGKSAARVATGYFYANTVVATGAKIPSESNEDKLARLKRDLIRLQVVGEGDTHQAKVIKTKIQVLNKRLGNSMEKGGDVDWDFGRIKEGVRVRTTPTHFGKWKYRHGTVLQYLGKEQTSSWNNGITGWHNENMWKIKWDDGEESDIRESLIERSRNEHGGSMAIGGEIHEGMYVHYPERKWLFKITKQEAEGPYANVHGILYMDEDKRRVEYTRNKADIKKDVASGNAETVDAEKGTDLLLKYSKSGSMASGGEVKVYNDEHGNPYVLMEEVEPLWVERNKKRAELNKIAKRKREEYERHNRAKRPQNTARNIAHLNKWYDLKSEAEKAQEEAEGFNATIWSVVPRGMNLIHDKDGNSFPLMDVQTKLLRKYYDKIYESDSMEKGGKVPSISELHRIFKKVNQDNIADPQYGSVVPFSDAGFYADQIHAMYEDDNLSYSTAQRLAKELSKIKDDGIPEGYSIEMERGGDVPKKVIRRNLPINKEYKLIDSFYTGGLIENPMACDNCNKPIANVAVIEDEDGKKFHVGMDCAETLASIKHSMQFNQAAHDFSEANAIRAKVRNARKKDPNAKLRVENTSFGTVYMSMADQNGRLLFGGAHPKEFFLKHLPDLAKHISNPEKNRFMPRIQENYDFNFDFDYFKKELVDGKLKLPRYDGPKTINLDGYKAVVSYGPVPYTKPDGTIGHNDSYDVKVYKDDALIGERSFYMYRDIAKNIIYIVNEYEFNNFQPSSMAFGGITKQEKDVLMKAKNIWMDKKNEALDKLKDPNISMEDKKIYADDLGEAMQHLASFKNGSMEKGGKTQLQIGVEVEKEHRDLYLRVKKMFEANGMKMPISENEFYKTIAKAHLREDKYYYDKLLKYVEGKKENGGTISEYKAIKDEVRPEIKKAVSEGYDQVVTGVIDTETGEFGVMLINERDQIFKTYPFGYKSPIYDIIMEEKGIRVASGGRMPSFNNWQVYYMDNDGQKKVIEKNLFYHQAVKESQKKQSEGLSADYQPMPQ